jgi:hypothetical protein
LKEEIPYNNPKVHQLPQLAATGIGTARGLASVFNTVLQKNLIDGQLLQRIITPTIHDLDIVILHAAHKGFGFAYSEHPTDKNVCGWLSPSINGSTLPILFQKWLVGHPGNGGQSIDVDVDGEVVIAFVRNGLKPGLTAFDDYIAVRNALFEKLLQMNEDELKQ